MAYDPELADRVRELLAAEPDITERAMFGGLAFLVHGNMAVVANHRGGLMVRIDPTTEPELLATTPAEPVEMRGRPMKGWLVLASDDVATEPDLDAWVTRAMAFTATLPAKRPKSAR